MAPDSVIKNVLIIFFGLLSGCATYQVKVEKARNMLRQGNFHAAVESLKVLAETPGDDQLVYLLDYGVALQLNGQYAESIRIFHQADKIADIKDYHSLSRITGSLLLNEGMVQYKGEDYEKVLINAYLAINYIMLGQMEDALVEARRLNEKLYKYRYEAKRDYEQNSFAHYLAAVLWETDYKWDDAYLEYKSVFEVAPQFQLIGEDLIRSSMKAQRSEELAKWNREFPDVKSKSEWRDRGLGELVILFQQGWGPRKRSDPNSPRFPKLFPTQNRAKSAQISIKGNGDNLQILTNEVYNVQSTSVKVFNDAMGALIAKRVGGVVAKAVVADQIRQKNETLGSIAWIAMNLADQADVRHWSTLPESFQIARCYLKPGTYDVVFRGRDGGGNLLPEESSNYRVTINSGKKSFVHWRSLQ